jgi:hypothetical protein
MLIKQVDHNGGGNNIRFGDIFTEDQFEGETFDYFLTNPPFGVDWKKQQTEIEREHEKQGFAGRFGAGLPRVNDGSLLFLQHMIAKFERLRPAEHKHGSRLSHRLLRLAVFYWGRRLRRKRDPPVAHRERLAGGYHRPARAAFPDPHALVDRVKHEVPRCLTPDQRERLFLAPEPPRWCIDMHKWPYDGTSAAKP